MTPDLRDLLAVDTTHILPAAEESSFAALLAELDNIETPVSGFLEEPDHG